MRDSTEDLGIDDCSTQHPSLPTACPVDASTDEGSDLQSAIRITSDDVLANSKPRKGVFWLFCLT